MASNDNEVGYKKPPKHTQFKPGQSGNPKGRPKGVKNLFTDLREELEAKILVTEASQTQEVTKQRAMIKTLLAKALKGDARSAQVLITLTLGLEQSRAANTGDTELLAEDQEILEAYRKKLLSTAPSDDKGNSNEQS